MVWAYLHEDRCLQAPSEVLDLAGPNDPEIWNRCLGAKRNTQKGTGEMCFVLFLLDSRNVSYIYYFVCISFCLIRIELPINVCCVRYLRVICYLFMIQGVLFCF